MNISIHRCSYNNDRKQKRGSMFIMMNYKKPKRYFEKSGVVDPKASYYISMENVTNMDKQDIKTNYG